MLVKALIRYKVQGEYPLGRAFTLSHLFLALDDNTDGHLTQTEFSGIATGSHFHTASNAGLPTQLYRAQTLLAPGAVTRGESMLGRRRLQVNCVLLSNYHEDLLIHVGRLRRPQPLGVPRLDGRCVTSHS